MQPKHSTWDINSLSFSTLASFPHSSFPLPMLPSLVSLLSLFLVATTIQEASLESTQQQGLSCCYYFATKWIGNVKPMKEDLVEKSKYRFPGSYRKLLASHWCQFGSMPIFLINCCGQGKLLIGSGPNHTFHLNKLEMLYQTIWTK